jgi:hypothetical protein
MMMPPVAMWLGTGTAAPSFQRIPRTTPESCAVRLFRATALDPLYCWLMRQQWYETMYMGQVKAMSSSSIKPAFAPAVVKLVVRLAPEPKKKKLTFENGGAPVGAKTSAVYRFEFTAS